VGNYVIENPSDLGNYVIADIRTFIVLNLVPPPGDLPTVVGAQ